MTELTPPERPSGDSTPGEDDGPRLVPTALPAAELRVGDLLPTRKHLATNVSLFLYNAAVWNPHRIHYDATYATDVEGHAGIVIDGPLQGDWITQIALNWLGPDDELVRFSYQNRLATHLGETLTSAGKVAAVDVAASLVELELFVMNEQQVVTTPGTATVFIAR